MNPTIDTVRAFGGIDRLYGEGAYAQLARTHVLVAGVGGVGSWTVEALARSGVGEMTLIDADHLAESNLNRQLPALVSTLGASKVETLRARIADIHPSARVNVIDDYLSVENVGALISPSVRIVVDCVDAPLVKASLAAHCAETKQALIVCGAAGAKTDPTRIRIQDLRDCTHDPLLSSVRNHLRRRYKFAKTGKLGVLCVSSNEPRAGAVRRADAGSALACAGYGSIVTVTATMGMVAAHAAICAAVFELRDSPVA